MVLSGSGERIVFVHAEPGDESALTGGTIARLRTDGARVSVLYNTVITEADADATTRALAELGVRRWQSVPQRDADQPGVDQTGAHPTDEPTDEPTEAQVALGAAMHELGATAVVIGAVDDPVREALTSTAHAASLPVFWARTVRQATGQRVIAIDIGDQMDQKLRALQCFSTRWRLLERTRTLTTGATDVITETETFIRVDCPRPAPPETGPGAAYRPLSYGALPRRPIPHRPEPSKVVRPALAHRLLSGVGGLLLGILFGVLGTIAHQSTLVVFGVALPTGLIIAFVGIGALLLGLRLVVGDRLVVGLAATGLLVTIFVLSLRGSGGSVLVPAGLPGTLWTVVPALIAALVLAWPALPPRRR